MTLSTPFYVWFDEYLQGRLFISPEPHLPSPSPLKLESEVYHYITNVQLVLPTQVHNEHGMFLQNFSSLFFTYLLNLILN